MSFIPKPHEIYKHFKGNLYQITAIAEHAETGETLVVYQAMYGDFKIYARPLSMFIDPVDRGKYPDAAQEFRFELQGPDAARQKAGMKACAQSGSESVMPESASEQPSPGQPPSGQELPEKPSPEQPPSGQKLPGQELPEQLSPGQPPSGQKLPGQELPEQLSPGQPLSGQKLPGQELSEASPVQQSSGQIPLEQISSEPLPAQSGDETEEFKIDPLVLEFLDADSYEQRLNILAGLHHRITDDMITTMAIACDVEIGDGDIEERYESLKTCLLTMERYECNRLR